MNLTINLADSQAAELAHRASAQRQSPEELAKQLLGQALADLAASDQWRQKNGRRLDLIRKSLAAVLESSEKAELDRLQAELDQRFEASDDQLLAELNCVRQAAQHLTNGTAES